MNEKSLKNSILQWTIQGKLVPQDSNDEPASVLLDKIRKEKERLVREGKLKKDKQESIIFRGEDGKYYERIGKTIKCIDDEIPFGIPNSWKWCRLKHICTMQAGKNIKAEMIYNIKTNLYQYKCIGGNGLRGYTNSYNKEGFFSIVGRQGALCGCLNIEKGKFYATEHAVVVDTYKIISPIFMFHFLTALNLNQYATATAQPGLAVSNILEVLCPVPPLNEQQRIVEKLEALMPLIDRYEEVQERLDKINAELKDKLKASILQEAIQGKLVPQDPNDEPAIELLKRINPKFTPTKYDEPLPQGWSVCKMSMICSLEDGDKITGKEMINLDAKYLRGQSEGTLLTSGKYVTANSLVILVDGENSGELFRTPIEGYQGSTFKKLIIDSRMNEDYILQVINSLRIKLRSNKVGAAIPHLNKKLFAEIMVLIPPLNEQQRIVEKLELLFAQLDKLRLDEKD